MTVQELQEILKDLPLDREIFFDATKKGATMMRLISVDYVEDIETPDFQQYVLLASAIEFIDPNMN